MPRRHSRQHCLKHARHPRRDQRPSNVDHDPMSPRPPPVQNQPDGQKQAPWDHRHQAELWPADPAVARLELAVHHVQQAAVDLRARDEADALGDKVGAGDADGLAVDALEDVGGGGERQVVDSVCIQSAGSAWSTTGGGAGRAEEARTGKRPVADRFEKGAGVSRCGSSLTSCVKRAYMYRHTTCKMGSSPNMVNGRMRP